MSSAPSRKNRKGPKAKPAKAAKASPDDAVPEASEEELPIALEPSWADAVKLVDDVVFLAHVILARREDDLQGLYEKIDNLSATSSKMAAQTLDRLEERRAKLEDELGQLTELSSDVRALTTHLQGLREAGGRDADELARARDELLRLGDLDRVIVERGRELLELQIAHGQKTARLDEVEAALGDANARLEDATNELIAGAAVHADEVKALRTAHDDLVRQLTSAHAAEVEALRAAHQGELEALRQAHVAERAALTERLADSETARIAAEEIAGQTTLALDAAETARDELAAQVSELEGELKGLVTDKRMREESLGKLRAELADAKDERRAEAERVAELLATITDHEARHAASAAKSDRQRGLIGELKALVVALGGVVDDDDDVVEDGPAPATAAADVAPAPTPPPPAASGHPEAELDDDTMPPPSRPAPGAALDDVEVEVDDGTKELGITVSPQSIVTACASLYKVSFDDDGERKVRARILERPVRVIELATELGVPLPRVQAFVGHLATREHVTLDE